MTTPSIMIASQSTERVVKKSQRPMVNQGMSVEQQVTGYVLRLGQDGGGELRPPEAGGVGGPFQMRVGVLGDEQEDEEAPHDGGERDGGREGVLQPAQLAGDEDVEEEGPGAQDGRQPGVVHYSASLTSAGRPARPR